MQTLPIRFDVFALIMLLGVVQGVLLGVFFLTGSRRTYPANRYLGWMLFGLAALTTDMLLCYTNYMFRTLAINDSSEPINLILAPLFYGYVVSRLTHRPVAHFGWHALPALLWLMYSIAWLTAPTTFRYNDYIGAYHPTLPQLATPHTWRGNWLTLRDWINELTVLSALVYSTLALWAVRRAYLAQGLRFWQQAPAPLPALRFLTVMLLALPFVIILTKKLFPDDLGDYLIACYITLTIYSTTFWTLVGPPATDVPTPPNVPDAPPPDSQTELKKKYEKSALSDDVEAALLTRLTELTTVEKPFLRADISLPALARRLDTSPHYLSQVLNNRLGLSFFDWLAQHRIAEAQRLLTDPATAFLKIDEIAERVGYNSPSAFHTAFKRLVGQTPAQFRDAQAVGK